MSHLIWNEWIYHFISVLGGCFCLFNIHRLLLHGWCRVKLLPSRRTFCVHHATNHQCHFMQTHIHIVYVCLAVTCQMHFLAEWPGSCTCYCGNTGVECGYRNKSQHGSMHDHGEENSPAAPVVTRTRDLSITSPALSVTTELSSFTFFKAANCCHPGPIILNVLCFIYTFQFRLADVGTDKHN